MSQQQTAVKPPNISPDNSKRAVTQEIQYQIVFDKKVEFTTALAQRMIDMATFVGERPLRDAHVDFLVGEAKRGAFLSDLASLITCECCFGGGAPA